ncbi:glycosyltransferase family 2 protein [Hyphomicrobium sp.]|uniref:glycosyltransferase family 2 protein n=1 Tax=Hyphomicrobium sp. TaxID=82 RepID=UPI001DDF65D6|nr:glycosyltransferase family 2 protein [Hyphomicrobium sp.]MBY0561259.1 glycosyltransferase family 2 protein [Hyphomicrobium sp.]
MVEVFENVWIVIPCYNEQAVIGKTVNDVLAAFKNVVVVDDCSTDRSADIAFKAGAHLCRHPVNLGQGASLSTGISYALQQGATAIVTFDADGQHNADDARALVRALFANDVDVVLASRFLGSTKGMTISKSLVLRLATIFTRVTTGLRLTDTHNGLRAFKASAARKIDIKQNRMAHASEILHEISSKNLRYQEAPCCILYTDYSRHKGQKMSGMVDILKDLFVAKLN